MYVLAFFQCAAGGTGAPKSQAAPSWPTLKVASGPLLFRNVWPPYQPITQTRLLDLWLTVTVLYFAAGFLRLMVSYRHLDDLWERRRLGALCLVLVIFGVITVHNLFTRNWTSWFGGAPPVLFSGACFVGEAVLFPLVLLTLAYSVLTEGRRGGDRRARSTVAKSLV